MQANACARGSSISKAFKIGFVERIKHTHNNIYVILKLQIFCTYIISFVCENRN